MVVIVVVIVVVIADVRERRCDVVGGGVTRDDGRLRLEPAVVL